MVLWWCRMWNFSKTTVRKCAVIVRLWNTFMNAAQKPLCFFLFNAKSRETKIYTRESHSLLHEPWHEQFHLWTLLCFKGVDHILLPYGLGWYPIRIHWSHTHITLSFSCPSQPCVWPMAIFNQSSVQVLLPGKCISYLLLQEKVLSIGQGLHWSQKE